MSDNLELWRAVEKTDPRHTKKAKIGGHQITAIAPQYQLMLATEQFGPYGKSWGFKHIEHDYTLIDKLNLVVMKAVFFFPGGEFPITNSAKIYKDRNNSMVDDDFAKKIETDALTKALSKLGFNADVFMGRYDDNRYVSQVAQEFEQAEADKRQQEQAEAEQQWQAWLSDARMTIMGAATVDEIGQLLNEQAGVAKQSGRQDLVAQLQATATERKQQLTQAA